MVCKKMLGKNKFKNVLVRLGECFLPFIRWLFENRMMGTMFEMKTEELGGEGCTMWSLINCTACQVVGNQRKVTK